MLDSGHLNPVFLSDNNAELTKWEESVGQELEFGFDCAKCTGAVDESGTEVTLAFNQGVKIFVLEVIESQVHFLIGNTRYKVTNCIKLHPDREIRAHSGEVVYTQKGGIEQNFLASWFQ